ncbi:MAG: hypothetical protein OXT74_09545 [Candidatus Poribacteria bacterium]|nr:hypothetical protein [Candidatus Poribacteria bacterium]
MTIQTTDSQAAARLIRSGLLKEAAFLRLGIEKTTGRIFHFEEKYGGSLQELVSSTTPVDDIDLVEWEGEIETLYRLEENLKQIHELKVCK